MQTMQLSDAGPTQLRPRPLEGKTALVTGGSRGIGAAVVRRLASDGAAVAFTYSTSEARAGDLRSDVESLGGRVLALKADSSSATALREAVQSASSEFGGLDVFVSNAGILRVGLIDDFPIEDLDTLIRLNIRAAFIGIQAAVGAMRDGGRIITTGSSAANRIAFPGISAYAMTKSALQGLVRGLAVDLAGRKITVNNVQPGPIATEINPVDGAEADALKGMIRLGRYGRDEEIASMVAYLASPDAAFITGANLDVDGGYGF